MSVFEPKFQNPLTIRLGANSYVLADEKNPKDALIDEKGIIFLGTHYGLDIISDDGKKLHYASQRRIEKVSMEEGYLIAFEEGKSIPWKISVEGTIITRAKFDSERDIRYVTKALNLKKKDIPRLNDYEPIIEEENFLIEPKISNPVVIFINDDLKNRYTFYNINPTIITKEDSDELDCYSTRDNSHYGFKIISSKTSVTYPTQCPIQAVFYRKYKKGYNGRLVIYEQGKFHPWEVTKHLCVREFAHFNDFRAQDAKYLKDNFGLDQDAIEQVNAYGLKYKMKEK